MTRWKFAINISDVWVKMVYGKQQPRVEFVGTVAERLKKLLVEVERRYPHRSQGLQLIIDEFENVLNYDTIEDNDIDDLLRRLWNWGDDDCIAYVSTLDIPDVKPGDIKVYEYV